MKTLVIAAILIVPAGSVPQVVFDGGVFTEGPAAAPDGSIYFSDITGSARSREAGHIMRYDPRTNRATVFRSPSGMANGLVFDLEGRLLAAEGADHGGRRVTRTDMKTGKAERLATSFDGKAFNSPNDIAIDNRGRVYFTDPRYVGHEPVEQSLQAVYRIDVDGSVHRIIEDAGKPNGVVVSPDGKTLYVAGTPHTDKRNTILAYDLGDDGSAKFRGVLVAFEKGYADGLTVDRSGNIYCGCGPLGVRVFAPSGEEIGAIAVPGEATNVEFGRGDGKSWLYITAGKAMYRVRLSAEGYHPADVKR
jgi:gluconolactonase